MTKWGMLGLWLILTSVVWAADPAADTLSYMRDHPQEWPKQVTLKEAVDFKLILDGRVAGSATMPVAATADVLKVTDEGLLLGASSGQATVLPEKTDFWERVQARRAATPPAQTSAVASTEEVAVLAVQLPPNSQPVTWYETAVRDQFDPWLAKNPDHPAKAQVSERREAFLAEAARIRNGDVRRGSRWFTKDDMPEWRGDIEAQEIVTQLEDAIRKKNVKGIESAISRMEPYARTEIHPRFVRTAATALAELLPVLTPDWWKAQVQERLQTVQKERDARIEALRARCISFQVPGTPTPRNPDDEQYADKLYRPKAEYSGPYVHGPLAEYYPKEEAIYHHPNKEQEAEMYKETAEISNLKNRIDECNWEITNAASNVPKWQTRLKELQPTVSAGKADAEEKALALIQRAASGSPQQAVPLLTEARKLWPNSDPASRVALDQLAAALDMAGSSLAEGKADDAAVQLVTVDALKPTLMLDSPRRSRELKRSDEMRARVATVGGKAPSAVTSATPAATGASSENTDGTVSTTAPNEERQKLSQQKLDEAQSALLKGHFEEALRAYEDAKRAWPSNPALGPWLRNVAIGLGVMGLVLAYLLRAIRNRFF